MTLATSALSPLHLVWGGLSALLVVVALAFLWSRHIKRHKANRNIMLVASHGDDVVTVISISDAMKIAKQDGICSLAAWGQNYEDKVRVYLVAEDYPGQLNLNPHNYFL